MQLQPITNQATLEQATITLSDLNRKLDALQKEKEKVTKPLNEALKQERARFKPIEAQLEEAIATLKTSIIAYNTLQEAEARKVLQATNSSPVDKIQALAQVTTKATTDSGSITFTTIKRYRITNAAKIPLEYLILDTAKIKQDIKEGKLLGIPEGIEEYEEKSLRNNRA